MSLEVGAFWWLCRLALFEILDVQYSVLSIWGTGLTGSLIGCDRVVCCVLSVGGEDNGVYCDS